MNENLVAENAEIEGSKPIWRRLRIWLADQSGVAALEYAVVLGLIGVASMGAISVLGQNVKSVLTQVSAAMDSSPEHMPRPVAPPVR